MFNYFKAYKLVKDNSEEKIKYFVPCNWYGSILLFLAFLLVINDVLMTLLYTFGTVLYVILYTLLIISLILYVWSKASSISLTEHRFIIVKYGLFGRKIRKYYDVPFDKIRNISVSKFLGLNFIRLSFISEVGKLEKIKIYYNNHYWGLCSEDVKEAKKKVTNKLKEMQKVLDRGDF